MENPEQPKYQVEIGTNINKSAFASSISCKTIKLLKTEELQKAPFPTVPCLDTEQPNTLNK